MNRNLNSLFAATFLLICFLWSRPVTAQLGKYEVVDIMAFDLSDTLQGEAGQSVPLEQALLLMAKQQLVGAQMDITREELVFIMPNGEVERMTLLPQIDAHIRYQKDDGTVEILKWWEDEAGRCHLQFPNGATYILRRLQ